jgi:peptide deformylase
MTLPIRRFDDKILTKTARLVEDSEFGEDLESKLSSMAVTMYKNHGVGIAGPQVGDDRRILVIDLGYVVGEQYGSEHLAMVNPTIIGSSDGMVEAEEGCLSFPALSVIVERPNAIRVEFFSPSGERSEETFEGWQARIIQHEIDHLNGVTLLKRAGHFKRSRYLKKIKKLRKEAGL